jgi:hypothetical protein
VLLVVDPGAFIVCPIGMRVSALSLGFIVDPLALVDVAVCVDKLALAVRFIVAPLSFVLGAIGPNLVSEPVAHSLEPLPSINSAILQREGPLCDPPLGISLFVLTRFDGLLPVVGVSLLKI